MNGAARIFGALVAGAIAAHAAADRAPATIVAQRCETCHGPEGRSSNPDFPKLAGQNADYVTRQLANFKTGVRTSEPMQREVAALTGGEMRALAEWFAARDVAPEPVAARPRAELGRAIYFSGNERTGVAPCVSCHGPNGRGAMYLPRLAGQHARYLELQLRAFRSYARDAREPVMHSVVQNLSDAEIGAVAVFLSGMK